MIGGDIFERMSLIEDDRVVIGQDATARAADREIGEKESVVHHQYVRTEDALPRGEVEAIGMLRTLSAEAVRAVALNEVPDGFVRLDWQVRPAAVGRLPRPAADLDELLDRTMCIEKRIRLRLRDTEAAQAEIVPAALHQYGPEIVRHHRLQERNVLADQLLLQTDRVCRNDDP